MHRLEISRRQWKVPMLAVLVRSIIMITKGIAPNTSTPVSIHQGKTTAQVRSKSTGGGENYKRLQVLQ